MNKLTPKQFFATHPQISEVEVFAAFAKVMEPFAHMVEQIFQLCKGGSGGQDLKLRYEDRLDSLRFDLDGLKRFRAARQAVKWRGTIAKYHNNFVPLYSMRLGEIASQFSAPQPESELPATQEPADKDFQELLAKAEVVGRAHLDLLDEIDQQITEAPEEGLTFEQWLGTLGVTGWYLPHSRAGLERWRESIQTGLAALEIIRSSTLPQRLPEDKRKETLQELRAVCGALGAEQELKDWRDAVQKWLELPYWKKRRQVYEVWIVSLVLRSVLAAGGNLNADGRGQLILRSRKSGEPLAVLKLGAGFALEVWCEFPLPSESKGKLRPDIVFVLQSALGRSPLHFIVCKQGPGGELKEAARYVAAMPASSQHLVVKYADGSGSFPNMIRQARTIRTVGAVRPGGSGLEVVEEFMTGFLGGDKHE